jgi:hypothetical protein
MKRTVWVISILVMWALPIEASVINFDSVVVPGGTCVDATAYLGTFGVSFTTANPGATPAICSGSTTSIPVSGANFFGVSPAPGQNNLPLSYTLYFVDPLDSISFWRVGQTIPSTGPIWTATAFDSMDQIVGIPVGEPAITFNPSAQQFVIIGPDIRSLRVDANNLAFASANNPGLDDFNLVSSVPEPSLFLLFAAGVSALGVRHRRRR